VDSPLAEPLRHNAWATMRLLDACRALTPEQLAATAPGTFGSVLATLRHVVASEGFLRSLLTGRWPAWRWSEDEPPGLDGLAPAVHDCAAFWEAFLAEPYDPNRRVWIPDAGGAQIDEIPVGVVLTQVLDHGTEHRSQVSAILTSIGVVPPRMDGWAYGRARGRIVSAPAPPA
jgi:uncharacterized damage-inducible protein DinB